MLILDTFCKITKLYYVFTLAFLLEFYLQMSVYMHVHCTYKHVASVCSSLSCSITSMNPLSLETFKCKENCYIRWI